MTKIKPSGEVQDTGPHVVPSGNPLESIALGGGRTGSTGIAGCTGAALGGGCGSKSDGSVATSGGRYCGSAGADATVLGGTSSGACTEVVGVVVDGGTVVDAATVTGDDGAGSWASVEFDVHPASTTADTPTIPAARARRDKQLGFGMFLLCALGVVSKAN